MRFSLKMFLFCTICALSFSCQKEPDVDLPDAPPPPPPPSGREFSKLKSITYRDRFYEDSTCFRYDTANNKIRRIVYFPLIPGDSASMIYSYNDKNQLVTYEYLVNPNSVFDRPYADVVKMQFIRNSSGQLEKVLSTYREAKIQQSEGIARYTKNGDTTFITFIDSLPKSLDPAYYDLVDHYRVGLKNNRVVTIDFIPVSTFPGYDEKDFFTYNASGALISTKWTSPGSEFMTTYERGSIAATELQKFMARLSGDLYWFFRTKNFNFEYLVGDRYFLHGPSPLKSTTGTSIITFLNEYNSGGQLVKVTSTDQSSPADRTFETITYYP